MNSSLMHAYKTLSKLAIAWREVFESRHGLTRVLNAGLVELQRKHGMIYLPGMPTHVAIEVTNLCNGGCLLCPVGEGRRSRPFGRMSWDRFRKLVDDISPFARFVGLYNWGEPFLHPRIYEMIRYVKAHKIYTKTSSNLHPFRTEDAEKLVETGLDELAISLHGVSEESYRAYQPRHRLEEVLEKTRAIVAAKKRLGSETPIMHLGFIVNRYNEDEIEDLRRLADSLEVDYYLENTSLNLRLLPFDREMKLREVSEEDLRRERLERIHKWLPKDDEYVFDWYQYIRDHNGVLPPRGRWFKCISPWYQTIICWDGDVNLCCGSYDRRHSVGNVFEQSLRVIWNNALYRAARARIRGCDGRHPPVLCDDCPGALL